MATSKYAAGTKVSVAQSVENIKAELRKYDIRNFAHGETEEFLSMAFTIPDKGGGARNVRFSVPMPASNDPSFAPQKVRTGQSASEKAAANYEAEVARLWRVLLLGIKGKLVLVNEKVESLEEAFYPHLILPGGATVYEATITQVTHAYESNQVPQLLGSLVPMLPPSK